MAVEKGTLKILNRKKQLLTWDQIRRRQRSLDWHYLVCTDTKALVGQGPFCTAGLTKALHCRELGSPTSNRKRHLKRMVREISCFSLGHSYTFLYSWLFILKFSLWVRFLCSTCKLWLCSFYSSKFPCFPLTSIFSFPKLYWVSPLVGQPSWGFVPPDRTLILSPARQTSPMPQQPWKVSLLLLPKAKDKSWI